MKLSDYCQVFCFYCVIFLPSSVLSCVVFFSSPWIKVKSCDLIGFFDYCCVCQAKEENNANSIYHRNGEFNNNECISPFDKTTTSTDISQELNECLITLAHAQTPAVLLFVALLCYVLSTFGFFLMTFTDTINVPKRRYLCICAILLAVYHLAGLMNIIGCFAIMAQRPDATTGYAFHLSVIAGTYTVIQIILFWTVVLCHHIYGIEQSVTTSTDASNDRQTGSDDHETTGQPSFVELGSIGGPVEVPSVPPTDTSRQHASMAGAQVPVTLYVNLSRWIRRGRSRSDN